MLERYGKPNPIFGDRFHIKSLFFLYVFVFLNCFRILLNCAFYAFYKENQGLEVPRETRLEKLMRLLEVSKQMHGGKAQLSTKTISWMYFRCKSQMERIKVVAQGGRSRHSCGSYPGGSVL